MTVPIVYAAVFVLMVVCFFISLQHFERRMSLGSIWTTIVLYGISILVACSISLVFVLVAELVSTTYDDWFEEVLRLTEEWGDRHSHEVSFPWIQLQNAASSPKVAYTHWKVHP